MDPDLAGSACALSSSGDGDENSNGLGIGGGGTAIEVCGKLLAATTIASPAYQKTEV
jgi:hypothetical protein